MNLVDRGAKLPRYATDYAVDYPDPSTMVSDGEYHKLQGAISIAAGVGTIALSLASRRLTSPNSLPKVGHKTLIAGVIFIAKGISELNYSGALQDGGRRIEWALERGAAEVCPDLVETN